MDAQELVEQMGIEELVAWGSLLQLTPVTSSAEALKVALVTAIEKGGAAKHLLAAQAAFADDMGLGKPEKVTFIPAPLPPGVVLRLNAFVKEALINMLNDTDTSVEVMEIVYDNFFREGGAKDEAYEAQVSDCCSGIYNTCRRDLIRLLKEVTE